MHMMRSFAIGTVIAVSIILAVGFAKRAPDIAVAWGNARAEHERRGAAEDARRAEAEKLEAPLRAAREDYNEAHCKVTIQHFFGDRETVTNVRMVRYEGGTVHFTFGGGVNRADAAEVIKTEDCK
jgi:hypothetical protein